MKTKFNLFILSLLILTFPALLNAQQPTFAKVSYDSLGGSVQAYSIAKTFDNNYMIAGEKDGEGFVLKIDTTGNVLLNKKIAGGNGDSFNNIISTLDSCFVLVGNTYNTINNTNDILCVKINSNGDTLWSKAIDMGFQEIAVSVQQTFDNGFIIGGYINQNVAPYNISIVVKLDSVGNISWSQKLTCGNHFTMIYSVKQTPDSGYIAIGYTENFPPYEGGTLLVKLSPTGNISWVKEHLGNSSAHSSGWDVFVTDNGIVCYMNSNNSGIIMMKIDLSGTVLWSKNYPLFAFSSVMINYMMPRFHQTLDGGFILANSNGPGTWGQMLKSDSSGNFLWAKNILLSPSDVAESSDGGYLVIGNGPMIGVKKDPGFNPQIGIIKTDALGNSSDCINQIPFSSDTCNINLSQIPYTNTTGGTMRLLHPVISNGLMLSFNGCVMWTGSIDENNTYNNPLIVYPNPTTGLLKVKAENLQQIEVLDLQSRKVQDINISNQNETTIDLSELPKGIYFVKIISSRGVAVEKVVYE